MKPRERVEAALGHREADRVPLDFGGSNTSIAIEGYDRLVQHLGLSAPATVHRELVADPAETVLERFRVDTRWVFPPRRALPPPENENPTRYTDEWGIEWTSKPGDLMSSFSSPLAAADTQKLTDYPWPEALDDAVRQHVIERAVHLSTNTDYAVVDASAGMLGPFELAICLRGYTNFMRDLCLNRPFAERLLDRIVTSQKALYRSYLPAVAGHVQVVKIGDDIGQQDGLMISPAMYRSILKPVHAELFHCIKKLTHARLMLHTCGSVWDAIEDLIEVGVDVLNPVQVSAKNMQTDRLKARFGDRITFWGGGCDTQRVLSFGRRNDVRTEVERRIRDLAPGGGFVFCQVQDIQPDVPPENVTTMFEAFHDFAWYERGTPPTSLHERSPDER